MTPEHIATFITEADIKQITSWGIDHVRLPVDYPVLEDDAKPFEYIEAGLATIDKAIEWCKNAGLGVIIDLHKAPGYSFGDNIISDQDEIQLFADPVMQKRFVALWEMLSRRYKKEGDNVIFELVNEITNPHGDSWNRVARMAIEAIWAISPERYIVLGGAYFNSAKGLETLEEWDSERMIYTFHFYDPFVFTHQRARWMPFAETGIQQPYPGEVAGLDILAKHYPWEAGQYKTKSLTLDKAALRLALEPAIEFMKRTGKRLYCGEYGAIDNADLQSRINWLNDMAELFNEYNISRACWTYKSMNFTTVDRETGEPVSEELVRAIVK
jgi:hypothetical protein